MLQKLIDYCNKENIWLVDSKDHTGLCNINKNGTTIFYDSTYKNSSIVLAHEIGHYLVWKHNLKHRYLDKVYNERKAWKIAYIMLKTLNIPFDLNEFKELRKRGLESYKPENVEKRVIFI